MACLLVVASLSLTGVAPAHADSVPSLADARQASSLSKHGVRRYAQGDAAAAAGLFLQAYALDPAPDYLYSAARAEETAGQWDRAAQHYEQLMHRSPSAGPFHPRAAAGVARVQKHLAADATSPPPALGLPRPATAAADAAESSLVVPGSPPPVSHLEVQESPLRESYAAYVVLGVGVGLLGVAAASFATAMADQADLDAARSVAGKFDPRSASIGDLQERQRWINQRIYAGWIGVGTGSAALITGLWLKFRGNGPVTLGPSPDLRGAQVAVRF